MSAAARLQLALARYGVVVILILLVAAAGAFFMGYEAYSDPPEETVTQEFDIEEYAISTDTQAVVDASDASLYEPGQELTNMPAYFYNESPNLTIVTTISTPEDIDVDLSTRTTIEHEAARDEQVFWDHTSLIDESQTSTADGNTTIEATENIPEVAAVHELAQSQVGTVGDVETRFHIEVEYESERYSGSLTTSSELEIGSDAYWLADDLEDSTMESTTDAEIIQQEPPMVQVIFFLALGIVLILTSGAIAGTLVRGIDAEQLRTELARDEYTEWISSGEIPTGGDKEFVSIDSLEDLVDVAIDSNRRVIFDAEIDTYGVVEDDLIYYYSPSGDDVAEWLNI